MHRGRACFERHGGRVKGRRGASDHRHPLAAQCGEIDGVGGMGVKARRETIRQHRRNIRPTITRHTIGEDYLACCLDLGCSPCLQMQPEMLFRWLDPDEPGAIADLDIEQAAVPAEILGPGKPWNALHRGVSCGAVPCLVPGLETERRYAEFRSRQSLCRS